MKNPIKKAEDLMGGKLKEIMSYYMLNDPEDRNKFLKLAEKSNGKFNAVLKDYEAFYGYTPVNEFVELEESLAGYGKFFQNISDVWMLEGGISYVSKMLKKPEIEKAINDYGFLLTILTGMEKFGSDPCGDSCFLDILPNALGIAEVIIYDHEVGKPGGYVAYSIADFISEKWDETYDLDTNEEIYKSNGESKKAVDQFNEKVRKVRKERPAYHMPESLFKRVHWMLGHPTGRPTYAFAEKMDDAPKFEDWIREKNLIEKEPVLANYWMLAHFFMGNNNACKEAIDLAKKSPGIVTQKLAEIMENLFRKPGKASLGKLDSKKLDELISETRKNLMAEHLEPERRADLAKERGEDKIKKLTPETFRKKVAEGAELTLLFEEYPDDVAAHDMILEEMGKSDEKFAKIIKNYFRERNDSAYNEWPYEWNMDELDNRLSFPVSAAFRSGLKFDEEHKKSYAGITRTLGKLDDDNAMDAYLTAFQKLNPDDDRIKYIIQDLEKSKHKRRNEILVAGAWRLFDLLKKAKENEDKLSNRRKEEGLTLDNMFEVENGFLHAVNLVLMFGENESEKLANEILEHKDEFKLFKRTLGDAFRVAGNSNLSEHQVYTEKYVEAVGGMEVDEDSHIEEVTLYNFTEAAIAFAKMDTKKAIPVLKDLFERETNSKNFDLDVKSAVIGGLLLQNPDDENLLKWLERLLGNRSNSDRLCGALRAVAETKLKAFRDMVYFHLYSDVNDFMSGHLVIKRLAFEAMSSLGEIDFPEFDDDDEFATDLEPEELPDAFNHPEKHYPKHVCERIFEKKYVHPDAINEVAKYLEDSLKFSADGSDHSDVWEGFKALSIQGPEAAEAFARILKLEHLDPAHYTNIIYVMRLIEPEAVIREWMYNATESEILMQLSSPDARFIPWLDLLAGRAFFFDTKESREAIRSAMEYRYKMIPGGWDDQEPTLIRLPFIYSASDSDADVIIKKMLTGMEDMYQPGEHLESALKYKAKIKADKIKPGKQIQLENKIKGEDYNGPVYSIKLSVSGSEVSFECLADNIYFQSIIKDKQLNSHGKVECDSEEKAIELAESIVKESMLLKYEWKK